MSKILITGSAGFLGSHLTKELLGRGHEVVGVDNLATGRLSNLQDVMEHPNFRFIAYDVSDKSVIDLDGVQAVDEIYHLASPASPKLYQAASLETIYVNTIGTQNMLELAKTYNAKVLYASTSEAYGDPEVHPQPEEYRGNVNTWGPRACYDEAKRLGEVFCYEYHRLFQLRTKVVRLFNTYSAGLRNDDGRVISNFVTQALTGEDITVYGDGSQTRSFCYVDDTIRALILMMEMDEATGQIINIGNPTEHSVLDVALLVKQLTNTPSKITFHPLPEDDPKVRRPVIHRATDILGWYPEVSLEDGLKRTIQSYQAKLALI
ncbi:UDP-glucuronic acid decarboxylase family protein [Paenibacillus roseipurpureus]|uniref:SDR family oxidoreductase n=1 Tax=Paenibacillus roseopurpureus TaxID=2918901 RepID=A0AA96LMJ2_9BACL|nr:UDP-glucuronic acid decarboxylase family protein [Paenibacillus sp. MBLB1832]WNR43763.1 SDR family oxidoreductase [Paenibacillus sp. MBLB1832]